MASTGRVMIGSVKFNTFKVLRDTILPLSPFTLLIGPNGSGKSTAVQALQIAAGHVSPQCDEVATAGIDPSSTVEIAIRWSPPSDMTLRLSWTRNTGMRRSVERHAGPDAEALLAALQRLRVYHLDGNAVAADVPLNPGMELTTTGGNLAGVLDQLRDGNPERFDHLNKELSRWLPEFDRILFATPSQGTRALLLRRRRGQHAIRASDLSQGTLLALAILTLGYLLTPPPIVCFEEPDRGIHPRLLREVRDAMYRLAYPGDFGEDREPAQVIATTHSPYFLDLFRDHPDEVVIAHRTGEDVRFERLSERSDVEGLLSDIHLGEAWYSGVLGGVPEEG